jgi:hypothetical protein
MCDEDEVINYNIGSLHAVASRDELPRYRPRRGPKVRLGFHPPEKGWIPAIPRKKKKPQD